MKRRLVAVTLAAGMAASLMACGSGSTPAAADGPAASPASRTTALCGEDRTRVADGRYVVQNNEYGSKAAQCVSAGSQTSFTVTRSSIVMATDGGPGGYPSIYQGCHWGYCTSGGLAAAPVKVADLTPGTATTSWHTAQPGGGAYNVAYDIWFSKTRIATGQPDCAELMVWLNHTGGVRPFGSLIASGVSVGGHSYQVWGGPQRWGDTITYSMSTGTTSVTGLDIGTLAQDAVHRGYLSGSCYLIDVEAGFELWKGGTGLATTSFSVAVH